MAGTLSTQKSRPVTAVAGRPNMHLPVIRQAAMQMAENRWKSLEPPSWEATAVEFTPSLEWTNLCRLHLEVSGFDFNGDPVPRKPGKEVADGPIANVTALLVEVEPPPPAEPIRFAPIRWDDVELLPSAAVEESPAAAPALELYEPPAPKAPLVEKKVEAPPVPPKPAEPVLEAVLEEIPEEPPFEAPPMRGPLSSTKPEFVRGPDAPPHPLMDPLAAPAARVQFPAVTSLPMRHAMVHGPSPDRPTPAAPEIEAVPAPQEEKSAPAAKAELALQGRKKKKNQKNGRGPVEEPVEEPDNLGEEVEAEIAASRSVAQQSAAAPEPEPALAVEEPAGEEDNRPLSFGGLADVKPEAPKTERISLGLTSESPLPPAPAGMGIGAKAGIAVALLGALGAIGFFVMGGSGGKQPVQPSVAVSVLETAGMVMGEAGWSTDYTTDDAGKRVRQLSFYRPSMQISDYRVEFQAEIEYKAVGWAVRASNTKSYWGLKLFQEGGRVKLRRFSVSDGKEGTPTDTDLPFPSNPGMVFKVRTDVVGPKFAVTVNDQKVEEWLDTQIALGGFGVANEGAERGQIRSIQLWHLRERQVNK